MVCFCVLFHPRQVHRSIGHCIARTLYPLPSLSLIGVQLVANSFRAHTIFIFSFLCNVQRNELWRVPETTLETVVAYNTSRLLRWALKFYQVISCCASTSCTFGPSTDHFVGHADDELLKISHAASSARRSRDSSSPLLPNSYLMPVKFAYHALK